MIFFRKEVQMNLYYIYHSCFAVEGKSHILIFDYYKIPKEKATEREYFFNRYIRQQEKKYMFFLPIAMEIILIRKFSLGKRKIKKFNIF